MTNTLAYCDTAIITAVKSFIVQAPGTNIFSKNIKVSERKTKETKKGKKQENLLILTLKVRRFFFRCCKNAKTNFTTLGMLKMTKRVNISNIVFYLATT